MASSEWLYSRGDNHQEGPVTAKELNRLADSGELAPDDLVWKEGMEDWVPASKIKGLNFQNPSSKTPPQKPVSKKFDAESLQSTIRDVQEQAEKAAGTFWFFDLKFNRFVSASIIRVIWSVYLLLGVPLLALGVVGSIFKYPIFEAVIGSVLGIIGYIFLSLMLRVWLEVFMVVFRISEQLREMNERLGSKE